MGKYRRDLERTHQPEPRYVGRRQRRNILALVDDAAACGLEKLGEQIEAGGLAGAIRTDQGMNGAARDTQVDAAYGYEPGEVLGEILGLEDDLRAHQLDVPLSVPLGPGFCLLLRIGAPPSPAGTGTSQPVSSLGYRHKENTAPIDQRLRRNVQ